MTNTSTCVDNAWECIETLISCKNRLQDLINDVSARVGSLLALEDPNSAQSISREWILKECDAVPPIDPCEISGINVIEQRYALAVLYFSLGGDDWDNGANPGQDANAAGVWLSGLNYCNWGNDIDCDENGNVMELSLCEYVVESYNVRFFHYISLDIIKFVSLVSFR